MEAGIDYSFIRSEKDNTFVVFILFLDKWKDREINFGVKNDKFYIDFEGENKIQSDIIAANLLEFMKYNDTPVVFHDRNGNFLYETFIKPISMKHRLVR